MANDTNKIGIITEYYDSSNYGGNLQAYALTRFLNENVGYAEQLPYVRPPRTFQDELGEVENNKKKFILFLKKVLKKIIRKAFRNNEFCRVEARSRLVKEFGRNQTPHYHVAFYNEDFENIKLNCDSELSRAIARYSVFITGSDQVWRYMHKKPYFLTFVSENKRKISYAASISKNFLTRDEKKFFSSALMSFDAISVREKSDKELIDSLCKQDVEWVLDPTLLLDECQWNDVCSPKLKDERYAFCYFLGGERKARKLARIYAKKYDLKLLIMPYLTSEYPLDDFLSHKNEEKLFEVSVEDFLSLIRYADMVFTDSFHAVVFSGIFKRQYYVFERETSVSMNSRIKSLLEIYETSEKFCDTEEKQNLAYLENVKPIDYNRSLIKLEKMKESSKMWLKDNIQPVRR